MLEIDVRVYIDSASQTVLVSDSLPERSESPNESSSERFRSRLVLAEQAKDQGIEPKVLVLHDGYCLRKDVQNCRNVLVNTAVVKSLTKTAARLQPCIGMMPWHVLRTLGVQKAPRLPSSYGLHRSNVEVYLENGSIDEKRRAGRRKEDLGTWHCNTGIKILALGGHI